jgi:hypothetical protein
MSPSVLVSALSIGLFLGMLVCLEFGYRVGSRAGASEGDAHEGVRAIEAAIFGLLGLLLGFAFAGAMSRLDARRQLIVREANAIGTAYSRLDVLPPSDQPELRRLFREYLESRFRAYDSIARLETSEGLIARGAQLQQEIWARATAASHVDQTQNTARVVLPAINEMIDVTTARTVALSTSLPTPILVLLVVVALLSALGGGYAMGTRRRRSLLHMFLYAAAVAITVDVVLDLDNPTSASFGLTPQKKFCGTFTTRFGSSAIYQQTFVDCMRRWASPSSTPRRRRSTPDSEDDRCVRRG